MVNVVINDYFTLFIIVQVSKIYVFYLMNVHANYDYDVENRLCYVIVDERWHYFWTH